MKKNKSGSASPFQKELFLQLGSLVILLLLLFFGAANRTSAVGIRILSPFGGTVTEWLPDAPGCQAIERAISVATLGTINITVEQLGVGPPKGGTFGLLRINGVPIMPTYIPGLPNRIYRNFTTYRVPGTRVIGNSINICDACKVNAPIVKTFCGIGPVKTIVEKACGVVGANCPLTNLIFNMGSGAIP